MATTQAGRLAGARTREAILRTALRLFTERGYDNTSTRDITDALGITKSTLFHHFAGKEQLVTSLLADRGAEVTEFLAWLDTQPPAPDLLRRAVHRWIDVTTPQRMDLMRFAQANQPLMRTLAARGSDIRSQFAPVWARLTPPGATPAEQLRVRMAFDAIGSALRAAHGLDIDPEEVRAAARRLADALSR